MGYTNVNHAEIDKLKILTKTAIFVE